MKRLICLLLLSCSFVVAKPEGVAPLAIGSAAPEFSLLGIDGKQHTLATYAEADVLAVLFTCNHCPSAQAAEKRLIQLVNDYRDQSFQLVAISSNDPKSVRVDELGYSVYGDSYEEMKAHAKDQGFNFPYLFDGEKQAAARAYGPVATPHIFIFDTERRLRYAGRIDDSKFAEGATQLDARNAIDALLAGQAVPVETTRAFGCSIKWADKRGSVAKAEEAWQQRPVTVEPIDVDMVKKLVANDTKKLRLINLWATRCGPCVEEFPELVSLGRQFERRGFDFISISMNAEDEADEVIEFLQAEHAALGKHAEASVKAEGRKTNNYHYLSGDIDAMAKAQDPKWNGGIPYTLIVAPGGEVIYRKNEPIDKLEVRRVIVGHLGRFYSPE